jgi:hypothetical protein
MKEEIVSFQVAKLAKEKGFDMECPKYWSNTGHAPEVIENKYNSDLSIHEFQAPTQSLLQKWLMEEHQIYAYRDWHDYSYVLWDEKTDNVNTYTDENIEDLDKLLQEALKLIKE